MTAVSVMTEVVAEMKSVLKATDDDRKNREEKATKSRIQREKVEKKDRADERKEDKKDREAEESRREETRKEDTKEAATILRKDKKEAQDRLDESNKSQQSTDEILAGLVDFIQTSGATAIVTAEKEKTEKEEKEEKEKEEKEEKKESSDEDNNDSVPGLRGCNRPDSDSEVDDRIDIKDELDTESDDQYYKIPFDLRMNNTISEWIDTDNNNDYDGDSDMPSIGDKSSYKNKDIKYKNNKKKSRKKEKSIVQKTRESDNADSSDEDNDDSVPGLQGRNRPDSDSKVDDRIDIKNELDTESDDQYYKIPFDLRMNNTISEWIDTDNNNDYDGDSDMPSIGDKSSYKNKDIKYKNNKKKSRKKEKSIVQKTRERVTMQTVQMRTTMIVYQVYKVVTDLIVIARWIIELILKMNWTLKVMINITKSHLI